MFKLSEMKFKKKLIITLTGALLTSCLFALLAYQSRQTAVRTGPEAYVPFRAMTVKEAGRLYDSTYNNKRLLDIVSIGKEEILITTSRYVLPDGVTSGEATDGLPSASWEGYKNLHSIPKNEFVKATGIDLNAVSLVDENDLKISFDSRKIPLYVVTEILFMTLSLSVLFLLLFSVRSKWWIIPVAVVWQIGYVFFVVMYSPAFWDADLFYQRLMVELPFPYFMMPGSILIPLAALMSIGGLFAWITKKIQSKLDIGPAGLKAGRRLALISPILAVIGMTVGLNFHHEAGINQCLAKVQESVDAEKVSILTQYSGAELNLPNGDLSKCRLLNCSRLLSAIEEFKDSLAPAMASDECGGGNTEITLFLPISDTSWLFSMIGPMRSYADIRNPKNSIGYSAASEAIYGSSQQKVEKWGSKVLRVASLGRASIDSIGIPIKNADGSKNIAAIVGQKM